MQGGGRRFDPGTLHSMEARQTGAKKPLTTRSVHRMRDREANVGLEQDDAAGEWLAENDKAPPLPPPKAAKKSVTLHRFRQRQGP